jgi:prepilin-type N-terminal cleavage/methylation domain-containing protein
LIIERIKEIANRKSLAQTAERIAPGRAQIPARPAGGVNHNNSGFTLIELIVAISLASLIILVTAMIFKQASKAFSESDARNEVYQNVRAAFGIIKRDISGAILVDDELFKSFDGSGYPGINAKGGSDILTFLSSTPNLEDKPIALITYYLSDSNILYKSEDTATDTLNMSMADFNPDDATNTRQLGFNVRTLQFRYFDKDAIPQWENTWDSTAKGYLPDAVEVKMTISDMQKRHTGTSTTIISIR